MSVSQPYRAQQGSVLVEFALILPLFMSLLFGTIFFSVAFYNKTVLTMATREGARAGVKFFPDRTPSLIIANATAEALQACQEKFISFGGSMSPVVTATISGELLTVSASGSYAGLYLFPELSLTAETSMRIE